MAHDLIIRGGIVVDGTGAPAFLADVAVDGGRIVAVGAVSGRGAEEIDARGKIVTPGFIDVHTHYDGQATWEQRLQPSSLHGVTTVVTGNCGVGFAPCRPHQRDELVKLMEGVEDVPEAVMAAGLPWTWQSFGEYLELLEKRELDVDVATQIPHSPIRVFVMGKRGADREPATDAEIAQMRALVADGIRQGAFGVSTSRFINHRTRAGEMAPSVSSSDAELLGLAAGLGDAGAGVFQLIPAIPGDPDTEFALMSRLAEESGRPLSFSLLVNSAQPEAWPRYLELLSSAQPRRGHIRGQVFPRPVGMMLGLDLSFHPFSLNPSYRAIANLPLAEKVAAMRAPAMRARLLAEHPVDSNPFLVRLVENVAELYALGDPPVYYPPPEEKLSERARRAGIPERELIYDALLETKGARSSTDRAQTFPIRITSAPSCAIRRRCSRSVTAARTTG